MTRSDFDDYINRFNNEDISGFEKYLASDVTIQNGRLCFQGIQGMIGHYRKIWGNMKESLSVRRFVSDDETLSVEMATHFEVLIDDEHSIFGAVKKGDTFDYHGIIMYQIRDRKFTDIKIAYLDFIHTPLGGISRSLGLVH